MQTVIGHYWLEVIPPRVFADDPETKHALRCTSCGKAIIVRTRDIGYVAISVGQKILGTKVIPCDNLEN